MTKYKFLEYMEIGEGDILDPYMAGKIINLPENYEGSFYIDTKTNNIEFLINIDSKSNIENFMTQDPILTEIYFNNFSDDYNKSNIRGWSEYIKSVLEKNGFEITMSGSTYNEDNYYFWGSVYEYVAFMTENIAGVVIMHHLGGDVRGNYEWPIVYIGDFGEFFSFEYMSDPGEELSYILGYEGDYKKFQNEVNEYVSKLNL